jgi:hypothetical protein
VFYCGPSGPGNNWFWRTIGPSGKTKYPAISGAV